MPRPVGLVEEPVEDHEQHADRDQPDHRRELLAVAREAGQDRLGDDPGGGARGERGADAEPHRPPQPRCAPLKLAISAARISTASRPSRKTMIAVFVITVVRLLGPVPTASSASRSARVERDAVAAISARRAAAVDQRREAVAGRPRRTRRGPRCGRRARARGRAGVARARARRTRRPRSAPAPRCGTGRPRPPSACGRASPAMRSKSALASCFSQGFGKSVSVADMIALVRSSRRPGRGRACRSRPSPGRCPSCSSEPATPRAAAASRFSSIGSMSRNALSAPAWNVIASWISKSRRTRPFATPRPYSTETSGVNVRTWLARRSCSLARERRGAERVEALRERARPALLTSARCARARGRRQRGEIASRRGLRRRSDLCAVRRREHAPEALRERRPARR